MIQNIILIILLILLLFFLSNEKNINDIISKNYVKFIFIIAIIYFVYQNYNIVLLVVAILIFIFVNVDLKEKFLNNKYLNNIDYFKNLINEFVNNNSLSKKNIEKFSDQTNKNYDFKPFNKVEEKKKDNSDKINNSIPIDISDIVKESTKLFDELNNDISNNKNIEPFKEQVTNLKELYENIKMEIKKLS
jgi:hypothetical protein